jgi:hypothetical protein
MQLFHHDGASDLDISLKKKTVYLKAHGAAGTTLTAYR